MTEDLSQIAQRVSAAREQTEARGETFYPGASPEVVTSSITAPLEKQFGQVPGLTQMTSISSFSSSLITLQFSLDLSIDVAEQEVQASINADLVRVSGKDRDSLQQVIALLKGSDFGLDLQFINYRTN